MTDSTDRGRRPAWVAALGVAIVTIAAFVPALSADFVTWDDDTNFLRNPMYRGLGGAQLHWMWTTFHLGHYVPLSWMTLGLDYVLWGMNPAGYHATNIVLHAANATVVFFIARRLLREAGVVRDDGSFAAEIAAAFAALIFAVHPLRVESVAWITERRDVLSGLFSSLTFLCYLRWAGDGSRKRWYWAAVALFACALLSKATPVTLAAVLVIVNVYPLKRLGGSMGWWTAAARRIYVELIPFWALAAAASVMAFIALQHVTQLSPSGKVAASAYSLAFYVWKTLAPVSLAALYKMPPDIDPLAPVYVASYAAVAVVSLAAWLLRRRWPGPAAAWLAFVVMLFPMLGLHQNGPQITADRYSYHASPVVGLLAAGALVALPGLSSVARLGIGAAVVALLGTQTWQQTETWHDSDAMWSQVLAVDSEASLAQTALANVLLRRGEYDAAIDHYQRSLAVDPDSPEAHDNLGVALSHQGRFTEAIAQYEQTLMRRPADYEAENDLGVALAHTGNVGAALDHYRRALAIKPDFPDAHVNWGNALVGLGKPVEAVAHYQEALRLRPDDADAERNWGVALAQQGELAGAVEHFRRALAIRPDDADARDDLERASAMMRRK